MIASAIISGVSALSSLLGGMASKSESDKLAAKIKKQQLNMPPEAETMLGEAKTLSAMGMPGYETYKEQINELMPQTAQAARETAQSPSALIDLYAKSMAQTNKAYNELAVQDAAARRQNILNYQNVLGQVAQMRTGVAQANIQTNLSALGQEAQGTKDLISGISNAPGAFIKGYVGMEQSGAGNEVDAMFQTNTAGSQQSAASAVNPALYASQVPPSTAMFAAPSQLTPTVSTQPNNLASQWFSHNRGLPAEAPAEDDIFDAIFGKYTKNKNYYSTNRIPATATFDYL
jgi:hypothetical protein